LCKKGVGNMKITIEIRTDNDAFVERYDHQLSEILSTVSYKVVDGQKDGNIRDINGNTVGKFTVEGE